MLSNCNSYRISYSVPLWQQSLEAYSVFLLFTGAGVTPAGDAIIASLLVSVWRCSRGVEIAN